ncbi:hypothetical protein ABKV35_00105 [Enterobacter kobei]
MIENIPKIKWDDPAFIRLMSDLLEEEMKEQISQETPNAPDDAGQNRD